VPTDTEARRQRHDLAYPRVPISDTPSDDAASSQANKRQRQLPPPHSCNDLSDRTLRRRVWVRNRPYRPTPTALRVPSQSRGISKTSERQQQTMKGRSADRAVIPGSRPGHRWARPRTPRSTRAPTRSSASPWPASCPKVPESTSRGRPHFAGSDPPSKPSCGRPRSNGPLRLGYPQRKRDRREPARASGEPPKGHREHRAVLGGARYNDNATWPLLGVTVSYCDNRGIPPMCQG
jgi:hypothetical protein